ncbi:hypothetical protein LZF95_01295 [Algoriphagus sp. AGSA1]|uniref:hypothetical protein n=1 Tax=Algoriphagus sp. AGSA1 TaxID=2907213 RepID=UPI001F224DBC|nr:hypothetical protein [Algoriphagus sp. AGSA1]MCE7053291.1 hypothetical protein [Algoriphagus sp. AGSA1]
MRSLGIFLVFIYSYSGNAQNQGILGSPIAEIRINELDLISFDTKDQLFVSNTSGDIYLFNKEGKQQNLFSPARQGRLDQLEAARTVSVFSFSSDLQEYRVLDRFLNPLAENGFSFSEVNLAKAATLGNNHVVWVWDESDMTLKSLDYLRGALIQSQPLNLISGSEALDVTEIREFKNRLFMNVPASGVFIFDNQGNLMRKIEVKGIRKLCYYKEHLLWLDGTVLKAISLTSYDILVIFELGTEMPDYLQIGQERIALVSDGRVALYPIPQALRSLE